MNAYLYKLCCILYKWKFKANFHEISCKLFHKLIQTYFSMKFGSMDIYHEGTHESEKNICYYRNTEHYQLSFSFTQWKQTLEQLFCTRMCRHTLVVGVSSRKQWKEWERGAVLQRYRQLSWHKGLLPLLFPCLLSHHTPSPAEFHTPSPSRFHTLFCNECGTDSKNQFNSAAKQKTVWLVLVRLFFYQVGDFKWLEQVPSLRQKNKKQTHTPLKKKKKGQECKSAWPQGKSWQGTRTFQKQASTSVCSCHYTDLSLGLPDTMLQKKVQRKEQQGVTGDFRGQTSLQIPITVCAKEWGQTPFVVFARPGAMKIPLQQSPNMKSFSRWCSTPWMLANLSPLKQVYKETPRSHLPSWMT